MGVGHWGVVLHHVKADTWALSLVPNRFNPPPLGRRRIRHTEEEEEVEDDDGGGEIIHG